MIEAKISKLYDLEYRTLKFANNVRTFVKKLSKTSGNVEDGKQLFKALVLSDRIILKLTRHSVRKILS